MQEQFGLDLTIAGVVGSLFGLMNLFARAIGGGASDALGKRFGMRGRVWALWVLEARPAALLHAFLKRLARRLPQCPRSLCRG